MNNQSVTDDYGDELIVTGLRPNSADDGAVMITARHPGAAENIAVLLNTAERRERFARLWTEACRRADGEPPAAQAAGDG